MVSVSATAHARTFIESQTPGVSRFPNLFFADWQWQDIQNNSKPMILDEMPKSIQPAVQVIDDWNLCRKLGLVFECAVGKGRLLVCSVDFEKDLSKRPTSRQLRESLLAYAASKQFQPKNKLEPAQLETLFAICNSEKSSEPM